MGRIKAIFVGGELNGERFDADRLELLPCFSGRYSKSYHKEACKGGVVPRKELWNRPIIEGYVGPMWDGDKLRYETQEVYDLYCDK